MRGERIVQAALDKVSKNRTTICIAHRLSTIKRADKICVLQKGRCVQEGTHEQLLEKEEGVYYGLVHAQSLSLGDEEKEESNDDVAEEDIGAILDREKSAAKSEAETTRRVSKWKQKGIIDGFGRLLYEQKSCWPTYVVTLVFAMCVAAAIPLQAYLFAKVIQVFTFQGQKLLDESRFWSLMWFVLAICVG